MTAFPHLTDKEIDAIIDYIERPVSYSQSVAAL
jgi:hypothetical protein